MAEKYYAVKIGMQRGIFRTWEECRINVSGYPGAEFKSFKSKAEACAYLGIAYEEEKSDNDFEQKDGLNGEDCVKIYVDGSYNNATKEFSYGIVVLRGGREEKYSRKFNDENLSAMRNVAGEIKGAEAAMQYAIDHHLSEIEIYYDYEGVAKWCLGEWKTNKEGTKAYKAFYDRASQQIKIGFVKVTSHSNNKYNDMADQLAKEALGLA
ncbi:MAG: reverse transcriptase-like protein [Lachnospiraceae bacterium]|nr:reverse transcriptase-like protein [Lachnospiraceae bacterium]